MLEDLEFDDADAPAIGLVPPGVSWEQVRDHIKIEEFVPEAEAFVVDELPSPFSSTTSTDSFA